MKRRSLITGIIAGVALISNILVPCGLAVESKTNPPPPVTAPVPLSQGQPATASSVWSAEYDPGKAVDGEEATRWGAAEGSRSGWIAIDLGKETSIGRAVVVETSFPRTRKFVLEWKSGDTWKELYRGTTIAGTRAYDFTPVTARHVRLSILQASDVPTIDEFQVFAPGAPLPEAIAQARQKEARTLERTRWFREAKFGMFICWGLYSVPGGIWKGQVLKEGYSEWIEWLLPIPHAEYAAIADTWTPDKFDADAWVRTAKDAGMKYLLLTAKFHDGFLMYPSKVTDYNIDRTPWKRDPLKELAEACARQGLTFGVYWNQAIDWQHPDGLTPDPVASKSRNFERYLDEVCLPQLKEMLMNYPQISFIWFDSCRVMPEMTSARQKKIADLIHTLRPNLIFNSRLGDGCLFHDYKSMGDNEIPPAVVPGVWETAATINHTWGYKSTDEDWKKPEQIIFNLVDIVSKGGNYILNVGPKGDGSIPQPSLDVLAGVGRWTKTNGEAIYGAGCTPFGDELGSRDWRCTVKPADLSWGKPGTFYFHLFTWPAGRFELPEMKGRVVKASMLADPARTPLEITTRDGKTMITLPEKPADIVPSVLCVEVE
jgi:alpha-L-fucosidase